MIIERTHCANSTTTVADGGAGDSPNASCTETKQIAN